MEKNKTQQVLEYIASHAEGLRLTQIQAFLWSTTYPGVPFTREKRGWWCCRLFRGGMYSRNQPILPTYCTKVGKRWVRNDVQYVPGKRA